MDKSTAGSPLGKPRRRPTEPYVRIPLPAAAIARADELVTAAAGVALGARLTKTAVLRAALLRGLGLADGAPAVMSPARLTA